ncbi:hypothetical protein LF41_2615 [Lysobacter dokdonensis DS-58]|uniref:Secreted protein n=1 Tax=Lysobacter dokdonensis DS-58 TaxID=1300345 RepID=A0A0A2WLV1_9GAMM|nr:hypothetical protein [Lysobacter dokdonensis]KGQ19677.1 hypothetical protein LF41_2615 [Lysobacter dokdonensis DS-58]
MRLTVLATAVSAVLLLAPAVHAQDARKSFTAQGPSEKAACDAANKQARDWTRQGKSQGRSRELLDDGKCTCAAAGDAQSCTLDVAVRDEQHEEEEER